MSQKTLQLKADTIVVLNRADVHTFVCFKYTDQSFNAACDLLNRGQVEIELHDVNGSFVNHKQYLLTDVSAPNRGNTIGGRDNVLIIEATLVD